MEHAENSMRDYVQAKVFYNCLYLQEAFKNL